MIYSQFVKPQIDIAELLAPSLAYELQIVPLFLLGETLVVATASTLSAEIRERLQFVLNRNVRGVIRSEESIALSLKELYELPPETNRTLDDCTFYWPRESCFDGKQLNIPCSGWSGSSHWSGCRKFTPEHPEYHMWSWIVSIAQFHRLIDEREIPGIRRIWNRCLSRRKVGDDEWNHPSN